MAVAFSAKCISEYTFGNIITAVIDFQVSRGEVLIWNQNNFYWNGSTNFNHRKNLHLFFCILWLASFDEPKAM